MVLQEQRDKLLATLKEFGHIIAGSSGLISDKLVVLEGCSFWYDKALPLIQEIEEKNIELEDNWVYCPKRSCIKCQNFYVYGREADSDGHADYQFKCVVCYHSWRVDGDDG